MHRELYDDLRGFDPHMRIWGVEDLDFSLKCWLMGHAILHDPDARIGHRFREKFDNYDVPVERVLVNKLRMAYKNFTQAVWSQWLERCRAGHSGPLADHPEGLWACAWDLFQTDLPSAEQERAYLHARRQRDEFWCRERFALSWPRLESIATVIPRAAMMEMQQVDGSPAPNGSPGPPPVFLDLAGTIDLDSPCKDLSLPGYPADSDEAIKLKSTFALRTEDAHAYEYIFGHQVINKSGCQLLPGSEDLARGEVGPGVAVSGVVLNRDLMQVPKGIYEYRARIEVRRKDLGGAFSLFVLRSCLFKVGEAKLIGWTGIVTEMTPCGKLEPDVPVFSNDKSRVQVLKDDPANHQFTFTTEIWDRDTEKRIVNLVSEEALKRAEAADMNNPVTRAWSESLYQHFVELRATSGRSNNGDPCKDFQVLQRIQCFFDSLSE